MSFVENQCIIQFIMERELMVYYNTHETVQAVTNWTRNRPPDMVRVEAIRKDMLARKARWVDGIILLWETPTEKLVCYDGIHRLLAAKSIAKEHEMEMVVQLVKTPHESYIIDEFLRINKSVPVSQLYSKAEEELDLRKTMEAVVQFFQSNYTSFFKPASKPNIPHENRDRMMERLYEKVKEKPKFRCWTTQQWIQYLQSVSERIRLLTETGARKYRLTKKQTEKCERHSFYLFAVKDWHHSI